MVICLSAVVTETVPRGFGQAGGREGRLTEDDGIGCCQIDTQTTGSGRQAKYEDIGTIISSIQCPACFPIVEMGKRRLADYWRSLLRPNDSLCLPSSNHIPPLINWTTTIQPQILVLPINQVLFRQIHHPSHLEVKKYTMPTIFQFP